MPAWRIAPPNRNLKRRAFFIRSAEPATSAPSGQPSPLDRQSVTVSKWRPISAAGTPEATAAFMSRAPSRWTLSPISRQVSVTATISSSGQTRPPDALWVFSSATTRVAEKCMSSS